MEEEIVNSGNWVIINETLILLDKDFNKVGIITQDNIEFKLEFKRGRVER